MYRIALIIGIAFVLVSCQAQELVTPLAGRWKYTAIQPKDSAWTSVAGTYYEQIEVEFKADGKISYYLNNTLTTDPCRIPCSPTAYTYSAGRIAFTDWASCPYVDCAPVTAWNILKLDKDVLEVAPEGISAPQLRLERIK
ncbi:hypothetical protein [Telluribacter sp. SYSU D00476]|uniref:hypothetical protein n=1 Tax=Telluribacter sp. SYSU D00476 TaxID=2811430 RepID=UPI001FF254C3|nr:hypothetical protein [Telluribacter sp. SYSU D00476]